MVQQAQSTHLRRQPLDPNKECLRDSILREILSLSIEGIGWDFWTERHYQKKKEHMFFLLLELDMAGSYTEPKGLMC
jgi:hypothetical protein